MSFHHESAAVEQPPGRRPASGNDDPPKRPRKPPGGNRRGCLPGPNGDWIFTRVYINSELGISFTTLRTWISDDKHPLPNYGHGCQGALIYASDLFPYIKSLGANTKAARTREFHAKRRKATPK